MSTQQTTTFLVTLAVIIAAARLMGALVRRLGQPPVIGEVLAGILLGPALAAAGMSGVLFPDDVKPLFSALANLGVAVFMFLVGLELDHDSLRGRGTLATSVSVGSIVLPLTGGIALSFLLARNHPAPDTLGFALFIGAAMSVTAFPVLARILTDRGMHRSPLGDLALTCAAVDDVLAWSLLAVVVAVTGADATPLRMLLVLPYLAAMYWGVRPLLRHLARARARAGRLTGAVLATVLAGLLVSGAATEWIGLHFIFGAFLFGALMPREHGIALREEIADRLGQVSAVLLLPVFFVVAGMKVNLAGVDLVELGELGLILLVAIGGKFLGAFGGARMHGLGRRPAAALALLMNTRGLTELVILSVGLQLGLLDTGLYTLMVIMALVTTAMASPLLSLVHPAPETALTAPLERRRRRQPAPL